MRSHTLEIGSLVGSASAEKSSLLSGRQAFPFLLVVFIR